MFQSKSSSRLLAGFALRRQSQPVPGAIRAGRSRSVGLSRWMLLAALPWFGALPSAGGESLMFRSDISVRDADQIDVVYGPGSTLYGQDAISQAPTENTKVSKLDARDRFLKPMDMSRRLLTFGMEFGCPTQKEVWSALNLRFGDARLYGSVHYLDKSLTALSSAYPDLWNSYATGAAPRGGELDPVRFDVGALYNQGSQVLPCRIQYELTYKLDQQRPLSNSGISGNRWSASGVLRGRCLVLDGIKAQFSREFITESRKRLRTAMSLIPPLGPGGEEGAQSIALMMHTISGEAMLIGYPELAKMARTANESARRYLETKNDQQLVACARALRTLARALEELDAGPSPAASDGAAAMDAKSAVAGRVRVLIVDDSPLNATLLREGLTSEGFDAASVRDDFDLIISQMEMLRPHVVLVDWLMPGCDTEALCRHIQSLPSLRQTKLLLVTSLPDAEAEAISGSLGIAGALSKEQGIPSIASRVRMLAESAS